MYRDEIATPDNGPEQRGTLPRLATSFRTDAARYQSGRTKARREADRAGKVLHCGPAIVRRRTDAQDIAPTFPRPCVEGVGRLTEKQAAKRAAARVKQARK